MHDALVAAFLLQLNAVQSDECDWRLVPQEAPANGSPSHLSGRCHQRENLNLPTISFKWEFMRSVMDCEIGMLAKAAPNSQKGMHWGSAFNTRKNLSMLKVRGALQQQAWEQGPHHTHKPPFKVCPGLLRCTLTLPGSARVHPHTVHGSARMQPVNLPRY